MSDAVLDPRLVADTTTLLDTRHAFVRLARDARWPWIILIPRELHVTELHQLDDATQAGFMKVASLAARALQDATHCQSINTAMLGNVVAQLHCHVVARSPGDTAWPGPIWGVGTPEPREDNELPNWAAAVRQALLDAEL